ncbi:tRNA 4-thiouridine(8) synthase ThiI [Aestuariibacter halophilus]|uniref:tRNA sulfurtransferase n=1 Tax=Fluctibacter halophilus TaxID=226011 RepID=A0ABS8G2S5_9ALTE|nr:tRNA uracil 4-sulfurtransferase ThiI [Aestuariibacter halophilus]MCC2614733.1 tRNA 4-thiouridine(8) synthase ThiI [Aestuariibacter halophilus]
MKLIVKLHSEITIKSKSVRKRFTKLLESNIRQIIKQHDYSVEVRNQWDKLLVLINPSAQPHVEAVIGLLREIPGIDQVLWVEESDYTDMDDIYQQVKAVYADVVRGKRFCVRVKRRGTHDFTSTDIARYVGGGLNQHCDTAGVDLKRPEVTVNFEVDGDKLVLIKRRIKCLGGMPLPTQEDVLSLISGGFDSGVASYLTIRRGARTHYCFFNLGGREHEIGVKQVSHYLWKRFGSSHKVKFIAVDFEPVVTEILEKIDSGLMGVVLKRMMLRAATQVANNLQINALVTGESLGQVSSQTMTNLHVIEQVTEKLVLRPLICMDKAEIIDIARQIGTEDFAATMPEYCGVISQRPTVRAVKEEIEQAEQAFDMSLIDRVVRDSYVKDIRAIAKEAEEEVAAVDSTDALPADAVVIDVRAPEEEESKPLELDNNEVVHIPFFRLATRFADLPQDKTYYLYCEKGVMSKLQALLLHEQGYPNVNIYRP